MKLPRALSGYGCQAEHDGGAPNQVAAISNEPSNLTQRPTSLGRLVSDLWHGAPVKLFGSWLEFSATTATS